MRRILLPLLLVILFSMNVQAETYKISGRASYADDTPVALQYISVECEQGAIDCYQYRGTKSITDAYGYFTILIDANGEDNDLDIQLTLRGENFTHTIDVEKHQNSSDDRVYQDLQLKQNPPPSGVIMGLSCALLVFILAFLSVLAKTRRRLSTRQGRLEFRGYKQAKQLQCSKCNEVVVQHQLIMHLVVDHDMEPSDAGRLTGKIMRRTWSEEE
ncbi:MAG: hypothetical protein OSA38_08095 [Candidatus Poseidoniaceae archaeon]|nr:hypothetical protein [Candidatus Poseidoniaceae archaeon]